MGDTPEMAKCWDCGHAEPTEGEGLVWCQPRKRHVFVRCEHFKPKDEPVMVRCEDCRMMVPRSTVWWCNSRLHAVAFPSAPRECPQFKPKEKPEMSTDKTVYEATQALFDAVRSSSFNTDNVRFLERHIGSLASKLVVRDDQVREMAATIRELGAKLRDRDKANNTRPDGGDITADALEERIVGLAQRLNKRIDRLVDRVRGIEAGEKQP